MLVGRPGDGSDATPTRWNRTGADPTTRVVRAGETENAMGAAGMDPGSPAGSARLRPGCRADKARKPARVCGMGPGSEKPPTAINKACAATA